MKGRLDVSRELGKTCIFSRVTKLVPDSLRFQPRVPATFSGQPRCPGLWLAVFIVKIQVREGEGGKEKKVNVMCSRLSTEKNATRHQLRTSNSECCFSYILFCFLKLYV